jgi:hypothetical protein
MTQGEYSSMSAQQGSYACRITVDRQTADILREESKLVLVFNHETFEDFSDFTPVDQEALADIFCDAIAVIKAVGWKPGPAPDGAEQFEIPLTAGHIEQLHKRRDDLDAFIRDLLYDLEHTETDEQAAAIDAEITTTHRATETLDRLFTDYTRATTA